ncbi:tRNA pseudouridine(55) synthase TruB [Beggiatoa leptomitoformis]|uniref:tRNA pseudouridine synthase B n=1 Tax=Beggiatoa leptomitoformis TaxID=288004 RepID=A0A2N9YDN8_9GAMM|nr:tRNA pseudouridine(55) synthase TruB [Beggiatoa leptomitoformis]ALG69003.1 tRNA pseudouridine(55) synthase TruB [Beggiatoa leptomitoformis]AUI68602.1 tRNA pseudouridine(55) synthase TruB [Beggiatoa leptomitoformis]
MSKPRRPRRPVHGIILLNKPLGISSNHALQRVKHLFQAEKAGHTGSLDNLATGLLPICLGEATKLSSFLLEADKSYRAECTLGKTTTTGDAEGDILQERSIDTLDLARIQTIIPQFLGEIQQVPPMYSALKHQGQPLYRLARQGISIERPARAVTIYAIEIISFQENRLTIEIRCSKGTYIRTLAEDMGEALGCGAYISALHRIGVGQYQTMLDMDTLTEAAAQGQTALDACLQPLYSALPWWSTVCLSAQQAAAIQHGQAVSLAHDIPVQTWVKLLTTPTPRCDKTDFLGLGEVLADGRIAPRRVFNWLD